MKKYFILISILFLSAIEGIAQVNYPSSPTEYYPENVGISGDKINQEALKYSHISNVHYDQNAYLKYPLGALAKQYANAILNNNSNADSYAFKMMDASATHICQNEIDAPTNAGLGDMVIGGVLAKGKSKCVTVEYTYNGQNYEVGACK